MIEYDEQYVCISWVLQCWWQAEELLSSLLVSATVRRDLFSLALAPLELADMFPALALVAALAPLELEEMLELLT